MNNHPQGEISLNLILSVTTIIAVLAAVFFFNQNQTLKKLLIINNYQDCQKAKGSKVESNHCLTRDGRVFTQETPTPEPTPLLTPTPLLPSATPFEKKEKSPQETNLPEKSATF